MTIGICNNSLSKTQQQKDVNTNGSGQYFKALGEVKTLGCEIPMPPTLTGNDNDRILLWKPFRQYRIAQQRAMLTFKSLN